VKSCLVPGVLPDHYAALGLGRRSTLSQIRAAYRLLATEHHPDLNPDSDAASSRMQALNEAHETLSDPIRRRVYDRDLDAIERKSSPPGQRLDRNISQDVAVPIEAFLRGTALEVSIRDPANPEGAETYRLEIPPETAPGTRFRLPRTDAPDGGFVQVRVKVRPGLRFKARGSDLRCDLRISASRAAQGGGEMVQGATGRMIRVPIPARVARGAIVRIPGEGLPKSRGGRGDLLMRVTYRPDVRITRVR
jgi:curved DNA-binding protein